ncbi:MAG: hypothetical protein WCX96_03975 [Bacilli bacterium]
MTIQLEKNFNTFRVRLNKKSYNSSYIMIFKNKFLKKETIYDIVDITPNEVYSTFTLDIEIDKGEYVYIIKESDDVLNKIGIAYIN